MIGYLRYRRECIGALEKPRLRDYLIYVTYTLKARALHALGLHTWRTSYPDGHRHERCTWCGATR